MFGTSVPGAASCVVWPPAVRHPVELSKVEEEERPAARQRRGAASCTSSTTSTPTVFGFNDTLLSASFRPTSWASPARMLASLGVGVRFLVAGRRRTASPEGSDRR